MANSYLNRTQSSATSDKIGTFSAWIKLSSFSDAVFSGHTDSSNRIALYFSDTLRIYGAIGGSQSVYLITSQVFRDPSAFYHIVVAWDTTQGTAANRFKIYVNGSQITSFSTASYPSQDADVYWNKGTTSIVGARFVSSITNYFDGYMSHVAFVDGQQLAPTVFGETDSTSGIWKFKSPTGVTWGTNGFHLKFENSGNLGLDSSGNSNTFTVNGNGRQSLDTPTNVYTTLNSVNSWGLNVLSNSNLTITNTGTDAAHTQNTMHMNKGKWYMEFNVDAHGAGGSAPMFILSGTGAYQQKQTGFSASGDGAYGIGSNGRSITDGVESGSVVFTELTAGDKVQIAFDADAGKAWFGVNGTYLGSGNPATGANPYFTTTKLQNNDVSLTILGYGSANKASCNFGSGYFGTTAITSAGANGNGSLFEYDVPSGYYALNTKNLNTYG